MDYDKMLSALISGVFAFVGAIIAVQFQRKTMRDNWLLQKQSEVFSQFLSDFLEYRTDTTFGADQEKLCLAQEKIYTSANKVCLFLSDPKRKEFRDTFEGYMRFTPDLSDGCINLETIKKAFDPKIELEEKFQDIFERALCENRW